MHHCFHAILCFCSVQPMLRMMFSWANWGTVSKNRSVTHTHNELHGDGVLVVRLMFLIPLTLSLEHFWFLIHHSYAVSIIFPLFHTKWNEKRLKKKINIFYILCDLCRFRKHPKLYARTFSYYNVYCWRLILYSHVVSFLFILLFHGARYDMHSVVLECE